MSTKNFYNKNIIGFYNFTINKITLIIGSILFTDVVVQGLQKCYVCGPPFRSCDQFKEYKEDFIRECPPNWKGCSLQINGTIITRACEINAFSDCKTANQVSYCYCGTNLCNANMSIKKQITEKLNNDFNDKPKEDDDDDEDDPLSEGSGYQTSIMDYMQPKTTTKTPLVEINSSAIIYTMHLSLIMLILLCHNLY